MAERPIRLFGDPVLTTVSEALTVPDARVSDLVRDLLDSVTIPGRAGVAASQIGVNLRAFSYNIDGTVGYMLNPVLVDVSDDIELVDEGCLSVPGLWFPTPRHTFARARGIDLEGNTVEVAGTGLLAQALQHEIDHLDGMVYIRRLEPQTRREAMKAIRDSDWF